MANHASESPATAHDESMQYRLLFDHNPQPMWVFDRNTLGFLAVNDAAVAQYGYSRGEFLRMTIRDIRPPEDVPRMIERYEQTGRRMTSGIDHAGIWRHRKKDGGLFYVEIFGSPISFNGQDASLVLAIDVTERVRAEEQVRRSKEALRVSEEALRRQKDQFTTLVERIPDIVARLDRELRFLYISPSVVRATGKSPEEYVGLPRKNDGIPPDFARARDALSRKVLQTGQEQTLEFPIETPSGWRHFESRLIPEFAPDGSVESLMTLTRDITERRRTEQALRESEERYRSLTQAITSVFWTTDSEGRFVTPQPSWAEYTGQSWDELRDFGWAEALHPDDRTRVQMLWRAACASKTLYESAGRLWHASSRAYRHFEARGVPILNPDGSVREWVGMCSDVEDRKRAELLLACQKQALEMLAQGTPLMDVLDFLVRTIERQSTAGVVAAIHLLDESGESFHHAVAPSLPPSYHVATKIAVRSGQGPCCAAVTTGQPVLVSDVSADPRWQRFAELVLPLGLRACWSTPIQSSDGKVIGTFANYYREPRGPSRRDQQLVEIVTRTASIAIERHRVEQTLRLSEESLREADRRKDEFLATLAHELRNPLAPIQNSIHILRMAGTTGPAAERIHEMIERQVHHMVRLVDDLLEVSRITRGKIELRKERVELAAVVRSAVETAKPLIEAARHQLAITLPADRVVLEVDPVRIAQVLANLLNNAAKYTRAGGQIWLSARREGPHVIVSVRDNGRGIPHDMLLRVFEMFTQVGQSSGPGQGGLGIGLALCQSLVALHEGRIEARSEGIDQGSEFVVTLPLAAEAAASEPSQERPRPAVRFARRVLVVDDNRDSADSLAMLLRFLGFDAHVAYDGPSALDSLDLFKPQVVLLDIGLPEMDGYEVARSIRSNPRYCRVPLIAMTGWSQEEDRRRTANAGFQHHLVKPVALETLQTLLLSLQERNALTV